jgi:hypothetical protein
LREKKSYYVFFSFFKTKNKFPVLDLNFFFFDLTEKSKKYNVK